MNEQKQKILDFLFDRRLGVISSVNADGFPESALVAFSETGDVHLVFGTSEKSRKYANILRKPQVAMVISDEQQRLTLQYEGVARELMGEEKAKAQEAHIRKHPAASKFAKSDTQAYFEITPTWIRFADHHIDPNEIFELKF